MKKRTPAEIFKSEYLRESSIEEFCNRRHVDPEVISHVLSGGHIEMYHAVTLPLLTGTTATFWLRMQKLSNS